VMGPLVNSCSIILDIINFLFKPGLNDNDEEEEMRRIEDERKTKL